MVFYNYEDTVEELSLTYKKNRKC